MNSSVTTRIDPDACTGCGRCVDVCPAGTISMQDGRAVVTGNYSMGCGHCEAVCPAGAVTVAALENPFFIASAAVDDRWLPHGEYDTGQLVRLMRSRRSCRNFKDKAVEPGLLADLVRIGTTAPSGTNSQAWTFAVLDSRSEVETLGAAVAGYFSKLNRLAEKTWLRLLAGIFAGDSLENYYRRHYRTVQEGLQRWEREGVDTLFHGAGAVILVGGRKTASSPQEDALLASQNILLAAHSLGLGSCMIGFAVAAINRDRKIQRLLGIPADESTYAAIALGYPAERYEKGTLRKKVAIRHPLGRKN